jgi:hypothetical protein
MSYKTGLFPLKVPFALTHRSPPTLSSVATISCFGLEASAFFVRSFCGDSHPSQLFVGSASSSGGGSDWGRSGFEKEARRT